MTFDTTVTIEGVMLTLLTAGGIPLAKLLASTLLDIRSELREHARTLYGPEHDHESGLVMRTNKHSDELLKHRKWLIELNANVGLRDQDRT